MQKCELFDLTFSCGKYSEKRKKIVISKFLIIFLRFSEYFPQEKVQLAENSKNIGAVLKHPLIENSHRLKISTVWKPPLKLSCF